MASATGATVQLHYCMGKLMDASIFESDEDECDGCCTEKSVSKDCCKDEQKVIKTNDHQPAKVSFDVPCQSVAAISTLFFHSYNPQAYSLALTTSAKAHAPPLLRNCPIYIQVQNFRI